MYILGKLFPRTPLSHLQLHMEKTCACLAKLKELCEIRSEANLSKIEQIASKISELEHDADLIKNDIRASLPKTFLFSMDRINFLEILTLQDNLADVAEDIADILILKSLPPLPSLEEKIREYIDTNLDATWILKEMVFDLDTLIEASFGGPIAIKMRAQIKAITIKEHETDLIKKVLKKELFALSDGMKFSDFTLWLHFIEEIGLISHNAEKEALRIGMLLNSK
jgi:predicted phosphate transport protein (TIGR00153 family)